MVQAQEYLGKETAERLLEHYLFDEGPYRVEIIPKRVNPQQADEYIREKVAQDAQPVVCRHARKLIDFYELRRTLPHFRGFLAGSADEPEAFSRSAQVTMLLAEVGEQDDWKLANDYFEKHLLGSRLARERWPMLLLCWSSLGPQARAESFEQRFADEVALREKTRSRSDEAELAYQELRAVYVNQLPRARRALEFRRKVEQMKGDARLNALIDDYARLDDYAPEYLNDWAARMLRRAASDDQTRAGIITRIRARLKAVQESKAYDHETKVFVRRRLLRAIQYFDQARLEDDERTFLEQQLKVSAEGDLLSTIQPEPVPAQP